MTCGLGLQVVGVLKKEVMKTQSKELEKGAEYRQLLVQAIHSWYSPLIHICRKYPESVEIVVRVVSTSRLVCIASIED